MAATGPALLARYERQRRMVTENFVQAQTIDNMKRMRDGWGSQRDAQRERMSRLVSAGSLAQRIRVSDTPRSRDSPRAHGCKLPKRHPIVRKGLS